MKSNLNNISNKIYSNIESTEFIRNTGAKMTKMLDLEQMGAYIQNNMRRFLSQDERVVVLPDVKHEFIQGMSLKFIKENDEKTVYLKLKAFERPSILVELTKGTYGQILNDVDRVDFIKRFSNTVDNTKDTFKYM